MGRSIATPDCLCTLHAACYLQAGTALGTTLRQQAESLENALVHALVQACVSAIGLDA